MWCIIWRKPQWLYLHSWCHCHLRSISPLSRKKSCWIHQQQPDWQSNGQFLVFISESPINVHKVTFFLWHGVLSFFATFQVSLSQFSSLLTQHYNEKILKGMTSFKDPLNFIKSGKDEWYTIHFMSLFFLNKAQLHIRKCKNWCWGDNVFSSFFTKLGIKGSWLWCQSAKGNRNAIINREQ